ncbi:MAG: MarR family transcriptional regulator [Flavobacteriales bacterium]|nr:MarR family transcriptional regulator [Flavobacteriales bacterium]
MNSQKSVKSKNFRSPIHKAELNILFTGNWLFEKVTALLKPYGISEQQYHVLKILKGKKGIPVNLQYLNDRMIYKMSNTTRLVEKLRLGEYLERSLCEHNRRMVEITITEEGLELLEFLDPLVDSQLKSSFDNLTRNEAEMLSSLLEKLRDD